MLFYLSLQEPLCSFGKKQVNTLRHIYDNDRPSGHRLG